MDLGDTKVPDGCCPFCLEPVTVVPQVWHWYYCSRKDTGPVERYFNSIDKEETMDEKIPNERGEFPRLRRELDHVAAMEAQTGNEYQPEPAISPAPVEKLQWSTLGATTSFQAPGEIVATLLGPGSVRLQACDYADAFTWDLILWEGGRFHGQRATLLVAPSMIDRAREILGNRLESIASTVLQSPWDVPRWESAADIRDAMDAAMKHVASRLTRGC